MAVNKLQNPTIHEILKLVAAKNAKADKVQILKAHNCLALRDVLKGSFDDQIQFLLPEGEPPYEPADPKSIPSSLNKQSRKFRYFAVGGPGERMMKSKVENMYIGLLEAIHPDDAELVIAMVNKQMTGKYRGLTKNVISEAFPNLLSSQ